MDRKQLAAEKAKRISRDALMSLSGQLLSCSDKLKAAYGRKNPGAELQDFTDAINDVENLIRNINFASLARIAAELAVALNEANPD